MNNQLEDIHQLIEHYIRGKIGAMEEQYQSLFSSDTVDQAIQLFTSKKYDSYSILDVKGEIDEVIQKSMNEYTNRHDDRLIEDFVLEELQEKNPINHQNSSLDSMMLDYVDQQVVEKPKVYTKTDSISNNDRGSINAFLLILIAVMTSVLTILYLYHMTGK